MTTEELVAELVALHGEQGGRPSADAWRAILAVDGPVVLLELLMFRFHPDGYAGLHSGEWDYTGHLPAVDAAFRRAGCEQLHLGRAGHWFGTSRPRRWHTAELVRYPSARALAGMWFGPVAAHRTKGEALTESEVLVFPDALWPAGMVPA